MLRFLFLVFLTIIISLNVVASNFTRLTGNVIDKPVQLVVRKGNVYLSVMGEKTKISQDNVQATLEKYRNRLPENEALFEEVKKWYNMTRTFIEKR